MTETEISDAWEQALDLVTNGIISEVKNGVFEVSTDAESKWNEVVDAEVEKLTEDNDKNLQTYNNTLGQ